MSIWTTRPDLDEVNRTLLGGHAAHLGMRAVSFDEQSLTTEMAITDDHRQPHGLLSGGASAALAEITAGIAGSHCIDASRFMVVGQELNISHLSGVRGGSIYATARPARLGRRSQVWHIDIRDHSGKPVATARLTNAVIEQRGEPT
jgi:uncharacterized protein (TIGR00369 family)